MYTYALNILLVIIIMVFIINKKESFQSKILENTCNNLNPLFKNNVYDISRVNLNTKIMDNSNNDTFNLSSEDYHKQPFARCIDNVKDFNIKDNYLFNIPDKDIRTNRQLLSAGDIFYNLKNNCPNSNPIFF